MTTQPSTERVEASRARAAALGAAMALRQRDTRDAEIDYSETMVKLQERYASDAAEALEHYRHAVTPAHRAANAAMIEAERRFTRPR